MQPTETSEDDRWDVRLAVIDWMKAGESWMRHRALTDIDISAAQAHFYWYDADGVVPLAAATLARATVLDLRIKGVQRIGYGFINKVPYVQNELLVAVEGEHEQRRFRLYMVNDGSGAARLLKSEIWDER